MGIRDRPITARSPWQNRRLIGSIHRECLDHLIIFNEAHLRRVPSTYATYYNTIRTLPCTKMRHSVAPYSEPTSKRKGFIADERRGRIVEVEIIRQAGG